jgi:hypothetical protein
MFRQRLIGASALIILSLFSGQSQTLLAQSPLDAQQKQQKEIESKKELERKTLALLDEVISDAASLRLPENRALVLASAADLLWTRDEKRSRALFKEAINNLSLAAVTFDAKMTNEQRTAYWRFVQQRKEILQVVARRDADLALELLRASRPQPLPAAPSNKGFQQPDEEGELERSLAAQIATNDPKRAFQMAEDSLSKGLSYDLLNLLSRLNAKDSELAGRFADDIISKLHSENLTTNQTAIWFATELFRMGNPPEGDSHFSLGSDEAGRKPFKLDERQLRDLLEMVTTAALSETANAWPSTYLDPLMPEIEKRLPERAPLLRRRIAEAARTLDPQMRVYVEYQELLQRGSVEALLEAAAKAPDNVRELLYQQAAWKAFHQGDDERARQIVNDNIHDAANRNRILEDYNRTMLWNSARKDQMDDVRLWLSRIKSKDERASVLAQLAYGAAVKKDRKLALELLDEAREYINFKPKNESQYNALLQFVRVYALVEPAKAFEMIESLVDQANELLAAASVLNGFLLPSGTFRKGELVLTSGYSQVSAQFRQFGKELGALAALNFERIKAAANKFQRNETRIMAHLFIVQGVLSEQLGY